MKRYDKYKDSGISWIGETPQHWEAKRLGLSFKENKNLNSSLGGTEAYKFNYGTLVRKDEGINLEELAETYVKYTLLQENDIVINGLNLNYDFVTQRIALATQMGIITSSYLVLSPRKGVNYHYYSLLFKAMDSMKLFHGMGSGIRLTLSYKDLKNQALPLPPLSEQEAIVSYLEEKTAKIDRFISKKEEQILRLKELREAIIVQVVTRGIQPDVALRPSGVSWLGDIPKHWEKRRCKDLLTELKEQVGKNSYEYTLLSLTTNGVIVRDLSEGKGKFPKDFDSYKIVKPDNLVFCLFDVDETPRTVGHVKQTGILTGAYNVFEVRNVNIEYLYHYFISLDDRKALKPLYKGLRKVIPLPTFMAMPIFLPPLAEQEAIVAYITQKTEKIDQLIESYRQEIDRIKELKQGLISDAVLGRINVQTE